MQLRIKDLNIVQLQEFIDKIYDDEKKQTPSEEMKVACRKIISDANKTKDVVLEDIESFSTAQKRNVKKFNACKNILTELGYDTRSLALNIQKQINIKTIAAFIHTQAKAELKIKFQKEIDARLETIISKKESICRLRGHSSDKDCIEKISKHELFMKSRTQLRSKLEEIKLKIINPDIVKNLIEILNLQHQNKSEELKSQKIKKLLSTVISPLAEYLDVDQLINKIAKLKPKEASTSISSIFINFFITTEKEEIWEPLCNEIICEIILTFNAKMADVGLEMSKDPIRSVFHDKMIEVQDFSPYSSEEENTLDRTPSSSASGVIFEELRTNLISSKEENTEVVLQNTIEESAAKLIISCYNEVLLEAQENQAKLQRFFITPSYRNEMQSKLANEFAKKIMSKCSIQPDHRVQDNAEIILKKAFLGICRESNYKKIEENIMQGAFKEAGNWELFKAVLLMAAKILTLGIICLFDFSVSSNQNNNAIISGVKYVDKIRHKYNDSSIGSIV